MEMWVFPFWKRQPTDPSGDLHIFGETVKGGQQESGKRDGDESGSEDRRGDAPKDLGDNKCMERGLIVPYLGIKFKAFPAERGFGQLKAFVATDFDGGAQGH